jgi:hypothetical protein
MKTQSRVGVEHRYFETKTAWVKNIKKKIDAIFDYRPAN